MLKIVLGQMEVVCGQPEQNFERMREAIVTAKEKGADLIVFPEMCVGGYMLADHYLNDAFCCHLHSFNDRLRELSTDIGIIWGNLRYEELDGIRTGRDGKPIRFNTLFFAYEKAWVRREDTMRYAGFYIKHLNPDYRVFEDSRYFESALELRHHASFAFVDMCKPFLFKGCRIGLEICEDLWSGDYGVNMTMQYAKQRVDYIINASASPWCKEKEATRAQQIKQHAAHITLPTLVYVNMVGMSNNGKNIVVYDGGSAVYDKFGDALFTCNDAFTPEYAMYTGESAIQPACEQKLLQALLYAIKTFDAQVFQAKVPWIIGLSGGLDSSVSAALLCMALSSNRIIGYNMKSMHNSQKTMDNASMLAEALDIPLYQGDISILMEATKQVVQDFGYKETDVHGLVYENIQARIRGHLLATFASIHGGVICNNGNKVEAALGYCTLYGDSIGALCVLGDVLKEELFTLSHEINAAYGKEIIPTRLLPSKDGNTIIWEMPPSAELQDNQFDPMKWFYHDALIDYFTKYPQYGAETLLERYMSGDLLLDETFGPWLRYYHLDEAQAFVQDLEYVCTSMKKAVFKRIQMPPIITVSYGAFGQDYKENQMIAEQTPRYRELKQQLLSESACQ